MPPLQPGNTLMPYPTSIYIYTHQIVIFPSKQVLSNDDNINTTLSHKTQQLGGQVPQKLLRNFVFSRVQHLKKTVAETSSADAHATVTATSKIQRRTSTHQPSLVSACCIYNNGQRRPGASSCTLPLKTCCCCCGCGAANSATSPRIGSSSSLKWGK